MKMSDFLKSKGCFDEFVEVYLKRYPTLQQLYRVPFILAYAGDLNKSSVEILEGGGFWSDTAIEFMKIENPIYDMYDAIALELIKRNKKVKKEYEQQKINDSLFWSRLLQKDIYYFRKEKDYE